MNGLLANFPGENLHFKLFFTNDFLLSSSSMLVMIKLYCKQIDKNIKI